MQPNDKNAKKCQRTAIRESISTALYNNEIVAVFIEDKGRLGS